MNLVGFGLTAHDSSVAAYKDGKFLYRKAERQFKSKHAHGDIHWAKSVLDEWEVDDFELAVSTWLRGQDSKEFVKTVDNIVYIDHHYSHQLSGRDHHWRHHDGLHRRGSHPSVWHFNHRRRFGIADPRPDWFDDRGAHRHARCWRR